MEQAGEAFVAWWLWHAGREGALRLVGGEVRENSGYGVLEVFHDGAWGMFCDDLYTNPYYFDPEFTLVRPLGLPAVDTVSKMWSLQLYRPA